MSIAKFTNVSVNAAAWDVAKKIRELSEPLESSFSRHILIRVSSGVECVYEDSPEDGPLFTVTKIAIPIAGGENLFALFVENNDINGFIQSTFTGDLENQLALFD